MMTQMIQRSLSFSNPEVGWSFWLWIESSKSSEMIFFAACCLLLLSALYRSGVITWHPGVSPTLEQSRAGLGTVECQSLTSHDHHYSTAVPPPLDVSAASQPPPPSVIATHLWSVATLTQWQFDSNIIFCWPLVTLVQDELLPHELRRLRRSGPQVPH